MTAVKDPAVLRLEQALHASQSSPDIALDEMRELLQEMGGILADLRLGGLSRSASRELIYEISDDLVQLRRALWALRRLFPLTIDEVSDG